MVKTYRYFHVTDYRGLYHDTVWCVRRPKAICLYPRGLELDIQGKDLHEILNLPKGQVLSMFAEPNAYYPRIFRPIRTTVGILEPVTPLDSDDAIYLGRSLRQAAEILRSMEEIFETVEAGGTGHSVVYGNKIRNLLILACTEFETHCKGVLRVNGRNGENVATYSHLSKPLRLLKYKVQFAKYPQLGVFKPFEDWTSSSSLGWYGDYNFVKHDREQHFSKANIFNVLNAIASVVVMIYAQFGPRCNWKNREFYHGFTVSGYPDESDCEFYYTPSTIDGMVRENHKF